MSLEKHPLHLKNPQLHTSKEVQSAVDKIERNVPNDPKERIGVYMDRLESIFLNSDSRVRARNVALLRNRIYDSLIIKKENFPESYFDLQKRIARERGQVVEEIPEHVREQMTTTAIEDQKQSLDAWIDYLSSDDAVYPPWFKYYVWNQVTQLSQFDKERGEYKRRTSSTVAPFPDIFREPLAQISDLYQEYPSLLERLKPQIDALRSDRKSIQKKISTTIGAEREHLQTSLEELEAKIAELSTPLDTFNKKFPALYAELTTASLAASMENREEISGEWVKYRQGDAAAAKELFLSLEGKGTGWCTAGRSTAETQIKSGDFYVYYTKDKAGEPTQPRLAIRMDGSSSIGEVRGILPHQGVEPQMQEVLDKKLSEFGVEADRYQKKSNDMRHLTELEKKQQEGKPFTKDDLIFLYEINTPIEGFGYEEDPRIEELKVGRNIRSDIAQALACKESEVSVTREEALRGGVKFHYGDLDLRGLASADGLTLPQTVDGHLNLSGLTSAEGLKFPETVGGHLDLRGLTSADGLTLPLSVGGNLDLRGLISAEGLKFPETVGGDINLVNLKTAKGLHLPQTVGAHIDLSMFTSAVGIIFPQTMGGHLNLSGLTSAEGLHLPQTVGGYLNLSRLPSAEGLTLPQSVGGYLDLHALATAVGLVFPQVVRGSIDLSSLISAKGLHLPQTTGGSLLLDSLTSAEGLTLPQSISGDLNLDSLTSAEGLILPQTVGGDLSLVNLKTAKGLHLPQTVGKRLNLRGLTSADDLNFEGRTASRVRLDNLSQQECQQLINKYPHIVFISI